MSAGRVVEEEVPLALEDHEPRARDLLAQPPAAGERGERVLAPPHEQRRARRARRAARGRARASRSRPTGRARGGRRGARRSRTPSSTRRSPPRPSARRRRASRRSASRVMPSASCSPSPGVRIACARPCHLPSGKKPVALITRPRDAVRARRTPSAGRSARPSRGRTATTGPRPSSAWKRASAVDVRLPRPGAVAGRRAASRRSRAGRARAPASRRAPRRRASPATCARTRGSRGRRAGCPIGVAGGERLAVGEASGGGHGRTVIPRVGGHAPRPLASSARSSCSPGSTTSSTRASTCGSCRRGCPRTRR